MAVAEIYREYRPILPLVAATAALAWLVGWTIYARWFHPLAKVPGPFLASVTELYRFYYNFVRNGSYYLKFEDFRAKYGPVIRISPNEVLLADPDNYDRIYSMNSRYTKDPGFYSFIGSDSAIFCIISNEAHRKERAIFNPFFSRRAVLEQEQVARSKVAKFCARLERDSDRGEGTDISRGFRAISLDVITEYALGADSCYNSLDAGDFGTWYNKLIRSVAPMVYLFKIFPPLQAPMQGMPYWLAKRISPVVGSFLEAAMQAKSQITKVVKEIENGVKPERETIFHTIVDPPNAEEGYVPPSVDAMADEAFGFTSAASETAGNAMTICAFGVLKNKAIYRRLRKELLAAFPDPTQRLDYLTLEKLPYLSAVIKEGLRRSYGVIHPLGRIMPEGGDTFNGYYIPQGTVVSMSSWLMHRDPSAFPDPDRFDPDRWLDGENSQYRDRFMVPFSRGNRMCIGQPLAMCELYIAIGEVFRRFGDLEAPDIRDEDLIYEDYFSPFYPEDARPFKVYRTGKGVEED